MHREHCASTKGRKMGGGVGVQGIPCNIQRWLPAGYVAVCLCTIPLSLSTRLPQANLTRINYNRI